MNVRSRLRDTFVYRRLWLPIEAVAKPNGLFTSQYFMPHETAVATVRKHPAVLLRPITPLVISIVAAILLTTSVIHADNLTLELAWGTCGVLLLFSFFAILSWSCSYFSITNRRLILVRGLKVRQMSMVPLAEIENVTFMRSLPGRVVGYGKLRIWSNGQYRALGTVKYIPYPEQLYLLICGLLFSDAT
jgi:Bacterial PH domain